MHALWYRVLFGVRFAKCTRFALLVLQWWELHFGVFYTATGIIGVTEAQLTVRWPASLGDMLALTKGIAKHSFDPEANK